MFTLGSDTTAGLGLDGLTDVPLGIDAGSAMFGSSVSLRENFGPGK